MLNFKLCILAFCSVCIMACNPSRKAVSFGETKMTSAFFSHIAADADSIIVYKTNFRTKYIENNYALDYALFSESQMDEAVKYLDVSGDSQDIYLMRIIKGDNKTNFVYMSAKYSRFPDADGQPMTKCIGFGPAYYGTYNNRQQKITFNKGLKVVTEDKTAYHLEYKKGRPVLFILQEPLQDIPGKHIKVNKLVLGQRNKIAGKRPVAYPIDSLFRLPYLDFAQTTNHNIKMR